MIWDPFGIRRGCLEHPQLFGRHLGHSCRQLHHLCAAYTFLPDFQLCFLKQSCEPVTSVTKAHSATKQCDRHGPRWEAVGGRPRLGPGQGSGSCKCFNCYDPECGMLGCMDALGNKGRSLTDPIAASQPASTVTDKPPSRTADMQPKPQSKQQPRSHGRDDQSECAVVVVNVTHDDSLFGLCVW